MKATPALRLLLPAALSGALLLAACGKDVPPPPPPQVANPMGLSGTMNPEAEKLFSQARVLWRAPSAAARPEGKAGSMAAAERCSDPAKAVALLDKAINLEPKYAEAYIRRGMAKSEMGQVNAAFDDATSGLIMRPTSDAYAHRGLISMRGKNYKAARKDFEQSISLNSGQHLAYNLRGALALAEGQESAACEDFNTACSNGDCSYRDAVRQEGLCK